MRLSLAILLIFYAAASTVHAGQSGPFCRITSSGSGFINGSGEAPGDVLLNSNAICFDADDDSCMDSAIDDIIRINIGGSPSVYNFNSTSFTMNTPYINMSAASARPVIGMGTISAGNGFMIKSERGEGQATLAIGQDNNRVLVLSTTELVDQDTHLDFDHALYVDPTFVLHSATSPDTNNQEFLALQHDKTDGVLWTGTGNLKLNSPVNVASAFYATSIPSVNNAASPYTVDSNDYAIVCDATAGAVTINLPAVASETGRLLVLKKTDATANACTLDGNASETIDDATTQSITSQYDSLVIFTDGTEWWIR